MLSFTAVVERCALCETRASAEANCPYDVPLTRVANPNAPVPEIDSDIFVFLSPNQESRDIHSPHHEPPRQRDP